MKLGKIKEKGKAAAWRIGRDLWDYKAGLLLFAAYYIIMHMVFHAFCPLVMLTGFPCAGCGMTRAVLALLTGQFARSWLLNPMAFPVLLFAAYCIFTRYFLGKRIKGWKTGLILIVAGMLAAYLFRMLTVFPARPPYTYTSGNFLERQLPFYREVLHRLLGI